MKTMHAAVGDRVVIKRHRVGTPDRDGEIVEIKGRDGQPPYMVRWSDTGRVSWFIPGSDAFVQRRGDEDDANG